MEFLGLAPIVIAVTQGSWLGFKRYRAGRPHDKLEKWDVRIVAAWELMDRHKDIIPPNDMLTFEMEHDKYAPLTSWTIAAHKRA